MAFDPYELTYRKMKKTGDADENTDTESLENKGQAQERDFEFANDNPKDLEKVEQNDGVKSSRKEPFSGQDGLDDYETVDELSEKIEYGGKESSKKEDKAPTTEELRSLRKKQKAETASKRIRQKSSTTSQSTDVTHIKEIPTSVFITCQMMFPLLNKRDSVVAYILATSDMEIPDDIDDKIYDAVMTWREEHKDDNPINGVLHELKLLNKKAVMEEKRNRTLELGIAYIISDRLGYRKGRTENLDNLEITEDNIVKFLDKLREESLRFMAREDIKNGRPIR